MKKKFAILLLGGLALSSCSVTRRMEKDQYLLTRNRVSIRSEAQVARSERITRDELTPYIRQRPNKRLFGIPFYLQLYNLGEPGKDSWFHRAGEAPVVYDPEQTQRSVDALSIYTRGRGFFNSKVEAAADTLKNRKIQVEYRVTTGVPSRIGTIGYEFQDSFVEPIIRQDSAGTLIRSGDIFSVDRLQKERQRITAHLKSLGYYNFSIGNIGFTADTVSTPGIVNLVMRVRQRFAGFDENDHPILKNNTVYRIRNIYVQPDQNVERSGGRDSLRVRQPDTLEYRGVHFIFRRELSVRPDVLMRAINIYPNDLYNADQVSQAYDNIMKLNYFRSANIVFTELSDSLSNLITYVGDESGRGNYTEEGYLDCTIRCTPGASQSYSVDLEGTSTSTFYGISTTLGYQNRNLLKGAESIDFSVSMGYEFMRVPGRKNSVELGSSVGITFPRFIAPFRIDRYNRLLNPRTRLELSATYQNRPFYRKTLTSGSWGYSWSNRRYGSFLLRPIQVTVISIGALDTLSSFYRSVLAPNPYLRSSFKSQLIAGISGSYTYNNQLKNPGGNSFRLRMNAETNGNLLHALAPLIATRHQTPEGDDPHYRLLGIRYAQYARGDLDLSYKFVPGPRTALAARFYIGIGQTYGNSANSSIPFERQFYGGGPNSMRGWQVRTLGPGSALSDEYKPDGGVSSYPAQVGNFKLEGNLEFRFPIYKFLNGAVFADLGNIWLLGKSQTGVDPNSYFKLNRFYDQLAFNSGLGARFDFGFLLFRVDWGIRLHDPNKPAGQKWIDRLTLRQTAFNFSFGYPF